LTDSSVLPRARYRLRGLTRDPTKPNAAKLAGRGVEPVKGDLADQASLEAAFAGAHIVFGLTNFWETMDPAKEVKDGKLLVDTAKAANVGLFVWSALEPVTKISNGTRTKVAHFDTKAEIAEYAKSVGLPTVLVEPGFYITNFTTMMKPHKQADGSFLLALPAKPSTKVAALWPEQDYGAYVVEAIESPSFGPGTEVLAASEYITFAEIVEQWSAASGLTINYAEASDEQFCQMVPQGGEELVDMLRFFEESGYYGGKDIAPSQAALSTPAHSFKQFAEKQDWNSILA
jgi:uncharacterized protein YbjT (DUF2867 family)